MIGVDEGQFYPDLFEFCKKYSDMGKDVIVVGLQANSLREAFGQVMDIVPLCDKFKLLHAVCKRCGRGATFTHRKVASTDRFVIGGQDMYESACRRCFLDMLEEKDAELSIKKSE